MRRIIPSCVLLCALAAVLLSGLHIVGQGYRPPDDALRHCAKAVSGRAWSDVLVLAPGYTFDHHYGWHTILGALHRLGLSKEQLLVFSVVGLFFYALCLPMFMVRRGEYWFIAVALLFFVSPDLVSRFLLGRPYLLQTAVTTFICLRWRDFDQAKPNWQQMIALIGLTALAAWCRSTWYLFPLPVLCVLLTGRVRATWRIAAGTLVGILIGAVATGHPWLYLSESTRHFLAATQRHVLPWMLVTEFHPRSPNGIITVVVLGMLVALVLRKHWQPSVVRDTSFYLMLLSLLLGYKAVRFWIDFGVPALLCWMCVQLEALAQDIASLKPEKGWPRLGLVALAGVVFAASATADLGGRYSRSLLVKTLSETKDKDYLPEPGGIVYSSSMLVFFQTFYQNPDAPWRYVLGFEPGMMTDENRQIYRLILYGGGDKQFFRPWVIKMRPQDRMILELAAKPAIDGLEWTNVRGKYWSGRLKTAQDADADVPETSGDGTDASPIPSPVTDTPDDSD